MALQGKRIILGVTGSIAAYKACDVLRRLTAMEAAVRVVMTRSAQELVGPTTFRSLSGSPVATEMFAGEGGGDLTHISLADWADGLLIAPATANIIGKMANGIADDLLSTVTMASDVPTVLAPAMNLRMWRSAAVQANVARLKGWGYAFCGPVEGRLASGTVGEGRMAEPDEIVECLATRMAVGRAGEGLRVLVTAGPTREYIDPVRFISNPSSGRMGYAMAEAARDSGAEVVLVSGPTGLPPPVGITTVSVTSAGEMHAAVSERSEGMNVVIAVAAVGDYTPARRQDTKLSRRDGPLTLELEATQDIIGALGQAKEGRVLVGFAAETGGGEARAEEKLRQKNLDLIVLNDVTEPGAGFEVETNQVALIRRDGAVERLPLLPKAEVTRRVWREILILTGRQTANDPV